MAQTNDSTFCSDLTLPLFLGRRDSQTGGQVSQLQRFLAQDPTVYPEGKITGYFGLATKRAVQRWQTARGIISTGKAGSLTRAAIAASCSQVAVPVFTPNQTPIKAQEMSSSSASALSSAPSTTTTATTTTATTTTATTAIATTAIATTAIATTTIATTTTTVTTATTTTTLSANAQKLDYNNDGKLDQSDSAMLTDIMMGKCPIGKTCDAVSGKITCVRGKICDVNQDGNSATISDIQKLTNIILGTTPVPDFGNQSYNILFSPLANVLEALSKILEQLSKFLK